MKNPSPQIRILALLHKCFYVSQSSNYPVFILDHNIQNKIIFWKILGNFEKFLGNFRWGIFYWKFPKNNMSGNVPPYKFFTLPEIFQKYLLTTTHLKKRFIN